MELIKGYHLTQTEKKAITQMIERGLTVASNKPGTKRYEIISGYLENGHWIKEIRITTRARNTIGGEVKNNVELFTIKIKDNG